MFRATTVLLVALLVPFTATYGASYRQTFNGGPPPGWTTVSGTWSVGGGVYRSSAINFADIAVFNDGAWKTNFSYKVRIVNTYGADGNQAGVVYNFQDASNYYEVKFAPTGTAFLNKIIGGAEVNVATASYSGGSSFAWFGVEVIRSATSTTVKVNDATVFNNVTQSELGVGKIGLVTTFTDASFDNVFLVAPYTENFDGGVASGWTPIAGAWAVGGGAYRSSAIGAADVTIFGDATWKADFTYHAKVRNDYGAGGNQAGVVYNFQDAANYYDVKFAPTGTAYLNKVIGGTETNVMTAPYSGGSSCTWFDVEVIRSAMSTTVKVNGSTVFNNVTQSELGVGKIGLVTTFTDASFDDVKLEGPKLVFATGFENISLVPPQPQDCWMGIPGAVPSGCWQDPAGTDSVTGFSFPIQLWGGTQSRFQMITGAVPIDPVSINNHMKNQIQSVTGPFGNTTNALYQEVTQTKVNAYCCTQNSFIVFPASEGGDLYISFYLMLQPDAATEVRGTWRVVTEYKQTDDDHRMGFNITDYDNDGVPVFSVAHDNPTANPYVIYWNPVPEFPGVAVPVGQWFRVEVFWHRSMGSDGRYWVAVNNTTLLDRSGPNSSASPINRVFPFLAYAGGPAPFYQWVDDLEIWGTFPATASSH